MSRDPRQDPELLEALVRHHQGPLRAYLAYLDCPRDWSDDLVQDTLLALLGTRFELRADVATAGYLRKVAYHLLLKRLEREGRSAPLGEFEPLDRAWVAFDDGDGLREALRLCVGELVGRPAAALRLHYSEGWKLEAIGRELALEVASVKAMLLRTRARLRACIERRRAR